MWSKDLEQQNNLTNLEDRELTKKSSNISMFSGPSRRRSSMVAEAKQNSVKCNLPCFDEEDDGIPPFCRHELCPLDHRNKYLNLGSQDGGYADCCVMFGNVGFPFFDHRRGSMMGIATISTLMAIFITTYGCLSLAKDDDIILLTYWVRASAYNMSAVGEGPPTKLGHEDAFEVYIGLTSMLQRECVAGTGCFHYNLNVIEWWKSRDFGQNVNGMDLCRSEAKLDMFCDECRDVAVNSITAAFFACATLLFALYGCINRMKFVSDCPVQKLLGCFTDTWGALSLSYALYDFQNQCLWNLPEIHNGYKIEYVRGPGVYMYMFCAASGFIRAILHWLTPLPGQGIGCRMQLPTRDRAKETLAALTKWQHDTRQHIEVQFINVKNTHIGQGLNTAISGINAGITTSTTGLKTAGEATSRMLRSSIAIASSATDVVRRTSTSGNDSRNPSVVSALEDDGTDWEDIGDPPRMTDLTDIDADVTNGDTEIKGKVELTTAAASGGGGGGVSVADLKTEATKVSEKFGADSDEAKAAWQRVFDASTKPSSSQNVPTTEEATPVNSNVWWSPAALKRHLGLKFLSGKSGDQMTRASVRLELSKINIGAPTNVQHVVSAKVNKDSSPARPDLPPPPFVRQPGFDFRAQRGSLDSARFDRGSFDHMGGNRFNRRSLPGFTDTFSIDEKEVALQRLSVGLTRRSSHQHTNPMDEAYYELNRESETFSYSQPSYNNGRLSGLQTIPSPSPPSPGLPPVPPAPSPELDIRPEQMESSARNSTNESSVAKNLFGGVGSPL